MEKVGFKELNDCKRQHIVVTKLLSWQINTYKMYSVGTGDQTARDFFWFYFLLFSHERSKGSISL